MGVTEFFRIGALAKERRWPGSGNVHPIIIQIHNQAQDTKNPPGSERIREAGKMFLQEHCYVW